MSANTTSNYPHFRANMHCARTLCEQQLLRLLNTHFSLSFPHASLRERGSLLIRAPVHREATPRAPAKPLRPRR